MEIFCDRGDNDFVALTGDNSMPLTLQRMHFSKLVLLIRDVSRHLDESRYAEANSHLAGHDTPHSSWNLQLPLLKHFSSLIAFGSRLISLCSLTKCRVITCVLP
jgi:hypothetical protein